MIIKAIFRVPTTTINSGNTQFKKHTEKNRNSFLPLVFKGIFALSYYFAFHYYVYN